MGCCLVSPLLRLWLSCKHVVPRLQLKVETGIGNGLYVMCWDFDFDFDLGILVFGE